MFRTVEAEACEGAAGDAEREAGGVRLVGHQPVDPERDEPVHQDHPGEERGVHEHAGLRRRVAGAAEVGPPREQRDDRDAGDDRAVVEAPHDVEDEQRSEQRDCDLPAAAAAAGEAPGGDDERRRERGDEGLRQTVHVRRVERGHERAPVLGEDRVERCKQADPGDKPREHHARPRILRAPASAEQGACDARERGGDHHRLLGGRGMERLVRRDLPDDEDRDAVERIEPAADRECEQQSRGQPLCPRPAREQREQGRGRSPDEQIESDGDAAVLGELVERQRVADGRTWQAERAGHIEPAGGGDQNGDREHDRGGDAGEARHAASLPAAYR